MSLVDLALANPWATLDRVTDGPLHPGGHAATERLLDRAGVDEATVLLDVGCGAGEAVALAQQRGARAVGVDRSPGGDSAVGGDMTALPVANGAVDVVLAECVLCLADDLDAALAETRRVLGSDGRLALSDVVVEGAVPDLPDEVARALCLTGDRERARLLAAVEDAGYRIDETREHREDLLAMRDDLQSKVDYEGLLGVLGERGQRLLDGIDALERAVEDGRVGYVSVVASTQ